MKNVAIREEVQIRELGHEALVYDTCNKKVHVLNETAGRILAMLKEDREIECIAKDLSIKFDVVEDEIKKDIENIIHQFRDLNLLSE